MLVYVVVQQERFRQTTTHDILAIFSDAAMARQYIMSEIEMIQPNSWYPSKDHNSFYASKDGHMYTYSIRVFPVKDF